MIKYARLNFAIDIENLQAETTAAFTSETWTAHYNKLHYSGEWNVLALRSPGGESNSIFAELINGSQYEDTPLMEAFPAVKAFMQNLRCPVMSVRLLNLKAGAVIKPHTDKELCFEKGEARIHFPIFTNPLVEFYIEDELLKMKEGESWYINAERRHSVANYGTTDRIHLVMDCMVNEWLQEVFAAGAVVRVAVNNNHEKTQKVISELRRQNTETSNKIADDLLLTITNEKESYGPN